ncbi:hypothetical protein ECPA24_3042, partial [Escherichia coli PA24]
MADIIDSA